jgi:hypothetical protein
MNNSVNENLRELLAGFMDEPAARQTAEDIEKGEKHLAAYQAPLPDERVLAEVKKNVVAAVRRQHTAVLHKRILSAAVAAAVIVVSVLAIIRYQQQPSSHQTHMIAASVWEGADDTDVTVLKAEIENIQHELSGAQSDSISTGGANTAASELETELIEINGDMWKG